MKQLSYKSLILCSVLLLGVIFTPAVSEEQNWLAAIDNVEQTPQPEPMVAEPTGWTKPIPVSFAIDYTMASDYMFRGINFSEYAGENREALNHQLSVGTEVDLGQYGRVGGGFWFEWYADQNDQSAGFNTNQYNDTENNHIQEIDYFVYYGYTIECIGLDAELGFTWFHFPYVRHLAMGPSSGQVASGDAATTQELYLNLSWDDSILWRCLGMDVTEPILNPYLYTAWDLDLANGASYQEFGLSHDFALADWCPAPVIEDMTLTPSWSMAWSNNWLDNYALDTDTSGGNSNYDGLMNMTYGLNLNWSMSDTFGIPEQYGSLYLAGFINYSQALARHWMDDYFWGGMSVGYEW
jgi:hypothetical protein